MNRMIWKNIVYQGKNIGSVPPGIAKAKPAVWELGLQNTANPVDQKFKVSADSASFATLAKEPKFRPLLLIQSDAKKSETTKKLEAPLTEAQKNNVVSVFKKLLPNAPNCVNEDDLKSVLKPYKLEDVLIDKSYRVGSIAVASLKIRRDQYRCDGPPPDEWFDHWFRTSDKGPATFMGRNMALVDAYLDETIGSPWLFATSGDEEDGYKLFYDDFKHSAEISWKYQ